MSTRKIWLIIFSVVLVLVGWWYISYLLEGLPSFEELENPRPPFATRVYSIDGEVIDRFFEENRSRVTTLDSVPKAFIQALISTEDRRFYEHWGVNLRAVMRVVLVNLSKFTLRGKLVLAATLFLIT